MSEFAAFDVLISTVNYGLREDEMMTYRGLYEVICVQNCWDNVMEMFSSEEVVQFISISSEYLMRKLLNNEDETLPSISCGRMLGFLLLILELVWESDTFKSVTRGEIVLIYCEIVSILIKLILFDFHYEAFDQQTCVFEYIDGKFKENMGYFLQILAPFYVSFKICDEKYLTLQLNEPTLIRITRDIVASYSDRFIRSGVSLDVVEEEIKYLEDTFSNNSKYDSPREDSIKFVTQNIRDNQFSIFLRDSNIPTESLELFESIQILRNASRLLFGDFGATQDCPVFLVNRK